MKNKLLALLPLILLCSCVEAMDEAKTAVDAKTYTCRYLEFRADENDPTITKALALCKTDKSIREILAVLAGDACVSPPQ